MKITHRIVLLLVLLPLLSHAQKPIIFVVDSIPIYDSPNEKLNNLKKENVHSVQVIINKDSLALLGITKRDTGIFIITKAYFNRPPEIKKIPSVNQMELKGGLWYLVGGKEPYSGPFINYYLSGDKLGEGNFKMGKVNGKRVMYYENGQLKLIRHYADGIENGEEKEYYRDGILKQQGNFIQGKEDGKWEMYYPNGQLKQVSFFVKGRLTGESISYYSTGKIKTQEKIEDGRPVADPDRKKVIAYYNEGFKNAQLGNLNAAIKSYTNAIEKDPGFAEGYFARGTARLNNMEFDEAKSDFDVAIKLEPYYLEAYANRAFCLIRKYQLQESKKLPKGANEDVNIPEGELEIICHDLEKTQELGNTSQLIMGAHKQFCQREN